MACGIIFLSENFLDNATVSLSLGTENDQFPLSNIQNDATVNKFRSQENAVEIVIDMQQTRDVDSVAIAADQTGTLGLTLASYKVSLTTDFSGSTSYNIPLSAEFLMGYLLNTVVETGRFVEITLSGTGLFAEIGALFVGERIELTQNNLSLNSFRYGFKDNSTTKQNKFGTKFVDKRNIAKFISGAIEFCTTSEQETLDDMFIRHQRNLPLWMIVDKDGASFVDAEFKLSIYGYLFRSPRWSAPGGQTYSTTLRLDQVI